MPLYLTAVVFKEDRVRTLEYYFAEDAQHAIEQLLNAHPTAKYEFMSRVPDYENGGFVIWKEKS